MANIRVKDLPNAATLADADEMIIDSSGSGTRRIAYSELKSEVAADYVAAPSTYKLATLGNDNRLTTDQIPDTLSQGLNFVGNANSAGDLTSTTQGDFYVIQTAFGVYSVGDQAVYDGSSYVRVTDGTKQISEGGTGGTTLSDAQTELKIPSIGSEPNQSPLNLHLGSMAYQDSSAPSVGTLHSDGLARMRNTGGDVALWAESTGANVMIVNVIGASPNYIFDVRDDDVSKFRVDGNGNVVIGNIPTNVTGLASGTVYSDGGTLKIVS